MSITLKGQELTPAQQEVWDVEKEYYEDLYPKKLIDQAMDLYDERFIGWPLSQSPKKPLSLRELKAGRNNLEGFLATIEKKELELLEINVFEEVAVVYYIIHWIQGTGTKLSYPVIHTLLKQQQGKSGKEWKIIGGMSGENLN